MAIANPLVSYIIGSYNHSSYVEKLLNSIKNQGYSPVQLIIFDDASPDNSAEIIDRWISNNEIDCTFFKNENNIGLHKNIENALLHVKGKYLTLIAADDMLMPDALAFQVQEMEMKGEEYGFIYGDSNMIDQGDTILEESMYQYYKINDSSSLSGNIFYQIATKFYFFIHATLIRTESFKKLGFRFNKEFMSEDWDLELMLSRHMKAIGTRKIFASYRYLETSLTRTITQEEKAAKFQLSQAKMLLKYYNNSLNTKQDKEAIFKTVWGIFMKLRWLNENGSKQKKELQKLMFSTLSLNHKFRIIKWEGVNYFIRLKNKAQKNTK